MPTAAVDKKSLRSQCQAARERITPEHAKAARAVIARHLVGLIESGTSVVAGYYPVRGEIDVGEALAQLSERGHELCLPVIEQPDKPLSFRRWRVGHPLELGKYGIRIPPESEPALIPKIVIVPVVAFDRRGHRLGYGAGFYDKTIRALRDAHRDARFIGAAYSVQQVDAVPAEPHDEALDLIVTEKDIVRCGA